MEMLRPHIAALGRQVFFVFAYALLPGLLFAQESERTREREYREGLPPGFYVEEPGSSSHVTTPQPLVSLEPEEVEAYLREHPDLRNARVVLSVPTFHSGQLVSKIKLLLQAYDIPDDVRVLRKPEKLIEHLIHSLPHAIDFEPMTPEEKKEAKQSMWIATAVSGATFVSIGLFSYLSSIGKIPWEIIGAGVLFDMTKNATIYPFMRFWSNYFTRISGTARWGVNLLFNAVFSSGFYVILNSYEEPRLWPPFISTILPVIVLNSVFATTLSSATFLWEKAEANALDRESRAVVRSRVFKYLQIFAAPFWIWALNPNAPTLPGLDFEHFSINGGHASIAILSFLGAVAWVKKESIAEITNQIPGVTAKPRSAWKNFKAATRCQLRKAAALLKNSRP